MEGEQLIQFTRMQEDIKHLKKGQERIEVKLDDFIKAADTKYADKSIEEEVKALREERERRSYEWLKYAITTVVGAGVAVLVHHLLTK